MTENTGAGDGTESNKGGDGTGADPKKTDKTVKTDVKDAKTGEDTFDESVFDNPKLWTHPRFKSLNERAKRADALEKAEAEAEEKRLKEGKKFEELATKAQQERDTIKTQLIASRQDNRIISEASKVGVVDIETVLKLVDRTGIHVDDNGNVTGAIEAVQSLLATKPFLKGKAGTTKIGSDTNPGDGSDAGAKRFKLSQLQDPIFYRENEKDIMAAYKAGLIEDDITK